jgi:hypothetical protein
VSATITSRPYVVKMACEACVFGRGEHMCEDGTYSIGPLELIDMLDRDPTSLIYGDPRDFGNYITGMQMPRECWPI